MRMKSLKSMQRSQMIPRWYTLTEPQYRQQKERFLSFQTRHSQPPRNVSLNAREIEGGRRVRKEATEMPQWLRMLLLNHEDGSSGPGLTSGRSHPP